MILFDMGPSIGIEINNLKPSHSGNTSFAICANFDVKTQLKLLAMAFDQDLTCLIFPLRLADLPMKNSRKAQWGHLSSMNFNGFRSLRLYFSLKCAFPMIKIIAQWEHQLHAITFDEGFNQD